MEEGTFQKINQLLYMLKDIESALGEFYGRCSFFFPEDKDFWEELETEEIKHVEQLKEIITMVTEKKEKFRLREFNPEALKTLLEDIEDQRDSLEKGETNRDNALFIGRDCEDTLLEKQFYRAVKSNDPKFIRLTENIEQEEREHLEKLDDYIKSISIH